MYKKRFVFILLLAIVCILSSCNSTNDGKFNDSIVEFKKLYIITTDSITPEDPLAFIQVLQSEENESRIKKMKTLLEEISEITPEDSIDEYNEITDWYNGLLFLRDSYKKKDELTFDENRKIFIEIVLVQQIRNNYSNE